MKSMFKVLSFFFALCSLLFVSSCSNPAGNGKTGTITFSFGANPQARWTGSPPSPTVQGQLAYVIELWNGNSYNNLYKSISLSPGVSGHSERGVPLGGLKVKINATLNGYAFAHGATTLTVVSGTNPASVPMDREDYGIVLSENSGSTYTFSAITPLTVTVDNYAENATGLLSVALSGTNAADFTLSPTSITNIASPGTSTFTVTPNTGLAAGTYTATVNVSGGNGISASFDVSFTAVSTALYTVTFNSNGGSAVSSMTSVPSGTTISAPTPPTKFTYDFVAWYKEAALTNQWVFASDTVTAATTLYAKWTISMVNISAGSFTMGSTDPFCGSDESPHSVTLTSAFKMGKYPVTQAQYTEVMGSNPSSFTGNNDRPVERVSWYDALVFCNTLSMSEGLSPVYSISSTTDPALWGPIPTSTNAAWDAAVMLSGATGYRLPTEAEWEYACRAGTTSAFNWGPPDQITSSQANFDASVSYNGSATGAASTGTSPVGNYAANPWGLYDMHGNVCEWCWDRYGGTYYITSPTNDPTGPGTGAARVMRGGAWDYTGQTLRSAYRDYVGPYYNFNDYGFRVVRQ